MTKEYILDKHVKYAWECDQASLVIPYSDAANAMDEYAGSLIRSTHSVTTTLQVQKHILDEYAKQQSISFVAFRDNYRREQSKRVKEEEKRLGGIITWDYSPDEEIYDQFIEQQNKGNG